MLNGYKTYIGIFVAVAPNLFGLLGYDVTPAFGEEFTEVATQVITLVGALIAVYGRSVAKAEGWLVKQK